MKKACLLLQRAMPIMAGRAANSTPETAPTPVSVRITPLSTTVAPGTSLQLLASVTCDSAGKGVSWPLMQGGANCLPGCGTIAPATTPSGNAATNTAPSTVPGNPNVTVVATSVANTAVSATATVTVATGVGVSVSPGTASVAVTGRQQFTATVANDAGTKGV